MYEACLGVPSQVHLRTKKRDPITCKEAAQNNATKKEEASASAATVAASSVREGFRSRRWIAPLCVLRLLFGLPILVVLVPPTIAIPLFIAEAA